MVIKFNLQVAAFRKTYLSKHGIAEAVTLASLTAMIGYFNRFLRIDMSESLAVLFHECDGAGDIDNLCQYVVYLAREKREISYPGFSELYHNGRW